MAVQCKSGGSGIDLTRARIGIILNTGFISPGDYDQMMARQYRPGQTKNVVFYHLLTDKTVDVQILKSRQQKRDIVKSLIVDIVDQEQRFIIPNNQRQLSIADVSAMFGL